MTQTLVNRTQVTFALEDIGAWHKQKAWGASVEEANIDGTFFVVRAFTKPYDDGTYGWASPNGAGRSATFEQAKADAIADAAMMP